MKKEYLKYVFRIQYLGGFEDNFTEKVKWHRDFEAPGTITLENLNSIIQKILDWNDSHLYLFVIKGIKYAFWGLDELVVEDFDGTYLSCDIPLDELILTENEIFYYTYDFGDKHKFCLRILSEMSPVANDNVSFLIDYKGNNVSQNPLWIDGFPTFHFDDSTPINMLHKEIIYYSNRHLKWKVRFIQERDFEVLQKWRRSKDKRKWEQSVVILENDCLSLEEISEKIERHIKKIKSWIKIFNAFGLEGLIKINQRKKHKPNVKSEQSKLKTKRIIEIFHQKPKMFGINRSNWNRESIKNVYEKQYGEKIGNSTVGRLINNAGYKMKKARQVLTSPDPSYREKVELLLKTIQSLDLDDR